MGETTKSVRSALPNHHLQNLIEATDFSTHDNLKVTMIHYEDSDFLFTSSSVEVTFSDGFSAQFSNFTLRASTPIGDQLILSCDDDDSVDRIVRLVLIDPSLDWRGNQSYAWKLDSAWMSDPNYEWLHWNVESFVNSEIQVPKDNGIFACGLMEFHFSPIGLKHSYDPVITSTKVVLRDVQIGAHLSTTDLPRETYRPCTGHNCSVIDGTVAGAQKDINISWKIVSFFGAIIFLILAFICWHRRRREELYVQLSPTPEEDLTLTVEDTYESTAPRSTLKGESNTTR